jgi:hypothetical protein
VSQRTIKTTALGIKTSTAKLLDRVMSLSGASVRKALGIEASGKATNSSDQKRRCRAFIFDLPFDLLLAWEKRVGERPPVR